MTDPAELGQPDDEMFDLDAVLAEAAPTGKPFHWRFGGETFTLPAQPDFRAIAAMQGGDVIVSLRLLLGHEWDRLVKVEAVFDERAFDKLVDAYLKFLRVSRGESEAS